MKQLALSSLAAALITVTAAANAAPSITYDVQQVSSEQEGVRTFNNEGVLTYSAYVLPDFDFHTFMWKNGTTVDISDQIDPNTYMVDVSGSNDRGEFVGMLGGENITSFLYRDGAVTPIEPFPVETTVYVQDINNRGQVIGASTVSSGQSAVAFIWNGRRATVLSPLRGSTGATAKSINDLGIAVGRDDSAVGVIWRDGKPTAIPVPQGIDASDAVRINNLNGVILNASANNARRGLYSHDGHTTLLPLLNAAQNSSFVHDINNWGAIAGTTFSEDGSSPAVATLWLGNHAVNLNTLLSTGATQPQLTDALFINDKGQVVAEGPAGTFVLTPHIEAN